MAGRLQKRPDLRFNRMALVAVWRWGVDVQSRPGLSAERVAQLGRESLEGKPLEPWANIEQW